MTGSSDLRGIGMRHRHSYTERRFVSSSGRKMVCSNDSTDTEKETKVRQDMEVRSTSDIEGRQHHSHDGAYGSANRSQYQGIHEPDAVDT